MKTRAFVMGGERVVERARESLRDGANEVVVCADALPDAVVSALRALGPVRVRIPLATFDAELAVRIGEKTHPRDVVRTIARASSAGLAVDVVLPLAEELAPVAGRLHGLARAAPRVARFLAVPVPDDLSPLPPDEIARQMDEARAAAAELGVAFAIDDEARADTELEAVLAGIKPVMRLSTHDDEASFLARYEKFGLVGCAADGTFIHEDGTHSRRLRLVYVAKSLAIAELVRAVEAKTFIPYTDLRLRAEEYRALGRSLGYPACCVDTYVDRVILDPESEMGGKDLTEPYVVARGGYGRSPAWQLNHFLFETGSTVIPFTPCGYRCAAALDYAARVLEQVRLKVPLAADRLARRLAVDVAVDRLGARAIVHVDGDVITRATPRRAPDGAYVHDLDRKLSDRVVGRRLRGDGYVDVDERNPPVVLRFSLTSPEADGAGAAP
jgi:hypothetical protein